MLRMNVTRDMIVWAREARAAADKRYKRHQYGVVPSDERWIGHLGKKAVDVWLTGSQQEYEFMHPKRPGMPDFVIRGQSINVHTVKRQSPPQPHWTMGVTEKLAHKEKPDLYIFCSYEAPREVMWIAGVMPRDKFIKRARRIGPGERVHSSFRIRDGHAILNINYYSMDDPAEWLHLLTAVEQLSFEFAV